MNASYWNTVNEGGEGYVQRAPAARSKEQIECDLFEAECDLKSAKINAAYKDGEDGTAYKVERLEKQVEALKAEMGVEAPAPVQAQTPVKAAEPAAMVTTQQKVAAQTQARMIQGKRRTHAEATKFAKAALCGAEKENFLAKVRAAFPELYQS